MSTSYEVCGLSFIIPDFELENENPKEPIIKDAEESLREAKENEEITARR